MTFCFLLTNLYTAKLINLVCCHTVDTPNSVHRIAALLEEVYQTFIKKIESLPIVDPFHVIEEV